MEVGDVFNKHFINPQVDIVSEEEIKIVKDYEITATPTLLFPVLCGSLQKAKIILQNPWFYCIFILLLGASMD